MRELLWMADGRGKAEWGRMSVLLAMLANINRDPKKSRPAKPSDFNPYIPKGASRVHKLSDLKSFFVRGESVDDEIDTLVVGMFHPDIVSHDNICITKEAARV